MGTTGLSKWGPPSVKGQSKTDPPTPPHLCSHSWSELCEATSLAGIISTTGRDQFHCPISEAGPISVVLEGTSGTLFDCPKQSITADGRGRTRKEKEKSEERMPTRQGDTPTRVW